MTSTPLRYAGLSDDHARLAEAADRLLEHSADIEQDIAAAGWPGIGVPEAAGGAGGSPADAAAAVEALGAHRSTSLAGWQAMCVAPLLAEAAPELLTAVSTGRTQLAIPIESAWQCATQVSVTGGRLTGQVRVLGDATTGALLPCLLGGLETIAVAPADHPAVTILERRSYDPTRRVADVSVTGVPIAELAAVVTGEGSFAEWTRRAGVVCALDAVGAARWAFEKLLRHASTRRQFGREIASFQAYKHRCAQAYVEFKLAQSLAFRAAAALGTAEGSRLALAAALHSPRQATFVIGEAIQLHGGIGFTWEAGLHAGLKRARVNEIIAKAGGYAARELLKESV